MSLPSRVLVPVCPRANAACTAAAPPAGRVKVLRRRELRNSELTDFSRLRCARAQPIDSLSVEARAPSPLETWDTFFSDFYLRAYAETGHELEAAADQALAAARLS